MSTFGTAVVVDVAPGCDVDEVQRTLGSETAVAHPDPETGWVRVTMHLREIEQVERVKQVLAAEGQGRAVVAEDYDEYGALWVVLAATNGHVRTVHRRYILNADPNDPADVALVLQDFNGVDPRAEDVPGRAAAVAAANLFGVDPAPMLDAEDNADSAYQGIGVVGGPFPWWDALGLAW